MRSIDTRINNNRIIKYASLIIICIGIIWLLIIAPWRNDSAIFNLNNAAEADNADNATAIQQRSILMNDEMLHAHFNELQKMDKEYASLLTDTTNRNGLVEMNARIASAEAMFRENIDSIAKGMIIYSNQDDQNLFTNMIASFRLALENRRSINNLRNAIGQDKGILNPEQKSMLKVENELLSKDTKISSLENELVAMKKNFDKLSSAALNTTKDDKDDYKTRNFENENKIANLTALNNSLRKEYERLTKQLNEYGKNIQSTENAVKTKNVSLETNNASLENRNVLLESRNISLEKKIDDLTTELSLSQVDCNIVRADVGQIISNSKQRRLLLSEALAILNSLAKPGNINMQKKIQDKINRLNQVATNYRD